MFTLQLSLLEDASEAQL